MKKMIYKGLVENTLLSGLEAECCTKREIETLENWNLRHMRKVLGSENSVEVGGVRRQVTNAEVRERFGTHMLWTILMKRRLDWLIQIISEENDQVQLRAAVFGVLKVTKLVDMGWNPWVRQWDRDLEIFAQMVRWRLMSGVK